MCINSKFVKVRTKYFYPGYCARAFLPVGCGLCQDCVDSVHRDYFVRLSSEFESNMQSGGLCIFLTYTFDEQHVPCVRYSYNPNTEDIDFFDDVLSAYSSEIPFIYSFRKTDLQTYFNSTRKYFERLGIDKPFRYFVVSEYGSDECYTQRPHFHALLFLSPNLADYYNSMSSGNISDIILSDFSKYWSNGIVSESKKYGLIVSNTHCMHYVSKYISKTSALSNLKRFSIFQDFILTNYDRLNPIDLKYQKSPQSLFRHYIRKACSGFFVLKSKNFGCQVLDRFEPMIADGDISRLCDCWLDGFRFEVHGETYSFPFSMYYFRKLFYNFRADGSYYLSDLGFKFRCELTNRAVYNFFDKFRLNDYKSILFSSPEVLKSLNSYQVSRFVNNLSNNNYLRGVYFYKQFLRGRYLPTLSSFNLKKSVLDRRFREIGNYTNDQLSLYFNRLNYGYIYDHDDVDSVIDVSRSSLFEDSFQKSSFIYVHRGFEEFLSILEKLDTLCRVPVVLENARRNRIDKYLRDRFNDFEYSVYD